MGGCGVCRHILRGASCSPRPGGGLRGAGPVGGFRHRHRPASAGMATGLPAGEAERRPGGGDHGRLRAAAATMGRRHSAEPPPSERTDPRRRTQPGPAPRLSRRRDPLDQQPAQAGVDADAAQLRPAQHPADSSHQQSHRRTGAADVGHGAAQHRLAEQRKPRRPAERAHRLGAHRSPDLDPDQQCSRAPPRLPRHPQAPEPRPGGLELGSGPAAAGAHGPECREPGRAAAATAPWSALGG